MSCANLTPPLQGSATPHTVFMDGGMTMRMGMPTAEEREKKPESWTWRDYVNKSCDLIIQRDPNAKRIAVVNNPYDNDIEDSEEY